MAAGALGLRAWPKRRQPDAEYMVKKRQNTAAVQNVAVFASAHLHASGSGTLGARRRIGRSFGARCAIAPAGSAGFICE